MFRLFIGNLDQRVDVETLSELFHDIGVTADNILVKRGYAFVDCIDQISQDVAIDKLNGKTILELFIKYIFNNKEFNK